jgi:predicted dehydrogenase
LAIIATPTHLHAPHTCLALAAGANVLCEKPLAGSLQDAAKMAAAERESKRFVAIGYQWAFSDVMQSLKREILRGTFGRPKRLKTLVYFPRSSSYFTRNAWVGRIKTVSGEQVLDSPVNNATAHYLQNMLYLLGSSRQTSASPRVVQTERYRANAIENFDTAAMRVITECGVELLFYTTHAVPDRIGPICEMEFEDATVTFDGGRRSSVLARFRNGAVRNYGRCEIDHTDKIDQCIDSVRSGISPACGIPAAIAHTLCVIAAHDSPSPIHTISEQFHRPIGAGNDVLLTIDGLSDAFQRCFHQDVLPGEAGQAPWALSSEPVDTRSLQGIFTEMRPLPQVTVTIAGVTRGVPA